MSDANKQLILRFIEAMSAGDETAADACLHVDAFTITKGTTKFAGRRPRALMLGTIDLFNQMVPTGLRPKILTVTAEENRVAVAWEGNAVTSDGKPYANQYCMMFFVQDGKILQMNEYFCTILSDSVLWPLVESLGGK